MPIANGTHISRPLKPGVFAPIPTFFLEGSQDLDIPSLKKHIVHVASAGLGIVMCGSMGEAHHLSTEERIQILVAAREALDGAGFTSVPIIAGTGAGSTRETIKLSKDAAQAGADYAIVIPSGYFAGALANDRLAIKTFFKEVAEGSPLPVMVYNYPGAAGGIDMDSDLIEEMAAEIPNLCGVKLTCGNVGKLTRIAATVSIPSFAKEHPRKNKDAPFLVLGGFIDFLLPSLYANAHGAITGLANMYPYTLAALWHASLATLPTSTGHASDAVQRLEQAQHLQGIVARADRTIAVTGIAGTKWLLERKHGYGGVCRRPLGPLATGVGEVLAKHKHVVDISQVESELEKASKSKPYSSAPAVIKATNGVQSAVPVSNSHDDSSTPPSSLSPATPSTSAVDHEQTSVAEKKKSHSRSGSLSNSVRSLFGSLKRKKATVA